MFISVNAASFLVSGAHHWFVVRAWRFSGYKDHASMPDPIFFLIVFWSKIKFSDLKMMILEVILSQFPVLEKSGIVRKIRVLIRSIKQKHLKCDFVSVFLYFYAKLHLSVAL